VSAHPLHAATTVAADTARPSAGLAMAGAHGLTSPSRRPGLFNALADAFRREVETRG
jgi:hypothetical protein